MFEQKWVYILLIFLFIVISSLLKWIRQVKAQKVSLYSIIKAIIIIVIASLALVVLISLPLIEQPRITSDVILPAGILLIIFGFAINILVARQLARIKFKMKGLGIPDQLITSGLFSIVRHPSSIGILGMIIGWYFLWGALYCLYFAVPIIVLVIFIENKLEERNLENNFGEEYKTYKSKVGMYFPIFKQK
ncbi:MAG: hypothetical protein C0417_04225 [Chlorobiaceae bacterium]|nr:hypothetical protein [Chlorobiaceae bacterium]